MTPSSQSGEIVAHISKCCRANARLGGDPTTTCWFSCTYCGQPCDAVGVTEEQHLWFLGADELPGEYMPKGMEA